MIVAPFRPVILGVVLALLVLPVVVAIVRSRRPRPESRPHLAASTVVAAAQTRGARSSDPLPPSVDDYLMSALRATGTRLPSEPSMRVARGTTPPPAEPPRVRFPTEPPADEAPPIAVRFSPTPGPRAPTTLDTQPFALPPVDDTDPYADPFDDDPPTLVTLKPFD